MGHFPEKNFLLKVFNGPLVLSIHLDKDMLSIYSDHHRIRFRDIKSAQYSIHQIALMGESVDRFTLNNIML